MIKCNQCGKMNAAGIVNCQSCGAPLSSTVDGGMSPMSASVGQPELPAWLESLRAGERSASPANAMSNFSAADFVDEDSLPSWMRAERNEARDNTGANPAVSVRPSSLPGPITDGERLAPNGIAARSLLDEQALPSWMREDKQSGPASAQEKIAASSLVQSENMPDWMKSLQRDQGSFPGDTGANGISSAPLSRSSQVSLPIPPISATHPQSAGASPSGSQIPLTTPSARSGQPSFSARDLIDPQSLPSWMVQQGERGGQPTQSSQVSQPEALRNPGQPPSGQPSFSARDLVDPQSLPSWMVQQGERGGQPTQSSQVSQPEALRNPGQLASGPTGFSARDLVDPQSLPSWMVQQGERGRQPTQSPQVSQPEALRNPGQPAPGQTFPASSLLDVNSLPGWLSENGQGGQGQPAPLPNQSFQAPSTTPPVRGSGGNMAASSLMDTNSMPEWMHQADLQPTNNVFGAPPAYDPGMPRVPGTPQPNIYAGPPKVENIRVPNRPRHEINPNENSEVAANVFSSMLGVASSTPNYPASSPQPQSSYQQPGLPGNPVQPYPMNQSGMPPSGSGSYVGPGMGTIPNTPGIASNAPQGYAAGNSYSSGYQSGMSSMQTGYPPSAGMPYASNSGPGQRTADTANEQKTVKKRGLFGAILEWLTR